MVIAQGEVWWAEFGTPNGSEPGFRRPVVVVHVQPGVVILLVSR